MRFSNRVECRGRAALHWRRYADSHCSKKMQWKRLQRILSLIPDLDLKRGYKSGTKVQCPREWSAKEQPRNREWKRQLTTNGGAMAIGVIKLRIRAVFTAGSSFCTTFSAIAKELVSNGRAVSTSYRVPRRNSGSGLKGWRNTDRQMRRVQLARYCSLGGSISPDRVVFMSNAFRLFAETATPLVPRVAAKP